MSDSKKFLFYSFFIIICLTNRYLTKFLWECTTVDNKVFENLHGHVSSGIWLYLLQRRYFFFFLETLCLKNLCLQNLHASPISVTIPNLNFFLKPYLISKLQFLSALVNTCFRLMKSCVTFSRPETMVANFCISWCLFTMFLFNIYIELLLKI